MWERELGERGGATETVNTASFMGGLVAQEAVKLMTKQYGAVNNTLVYTGAGHEEISVFEA